MHKQPPRVLVVDDNELNLDLARFQVQDVGLDVDCECDGEGALRALSNMAYGLLLLDLRMPDIDGREVLRRLRSTASPNRHIPVVALTAQAMDADRQALLAEGFDEVLYKPLEMDRLAKTLERFCPYTAYGATLEAAQWSVSPWPCLLERTNGAASLAFLLLEKLFEELPRQMRLIADALNAGQRPAALEAVHKLHGSAAYCGLPDIKAAADALERLLLGQSHDDEARAQGRLESTVYAFLAQKDALLAETAEVVGRTTVTSPTNP